MKIKLLILLLLTSPAHAFQFGLSTNYLKINDGYERDSGLSHPTINIGHSFLVKDLVLTTTTNRLFNKTRSETISRKGVVYESKVKIIADSLILGYKMNRFIPSIIFTNTGVEKSLYRGVKLGTTRQHSFTYGVGATYLYDKRLNFNTFFIAPNEELDLDWGLTFGINYSL